MSRNTRVESGPIGPWTLAAVVVLTVAASVAVGALVNVSGVLQPEPTPDGELAQVDAPPDQIPDRPREVATTGHVTANGTVDVVNVTVTQSAPGDGYISLANTSVTWVTGNDSYTLVTDDTDGEFGRFEIRPIRDADGSVPTTTRLDDPGDRFAFVFALDTLGEGDARSTGGDDAAGAGGSGDAPAQPNALEPGDEVTIELTTEAGTTTVIRFVVPESLDGEESVPL
ncbi:hypothetical protein RYH80_00300 [Halobaculum sp. MBLA0147]|uniref:hypothetical protein n=1 Tax=Halobaculum sp. MBLA0147 TaxID=3079934 RepID=UPI003526013D